MKPTPMLGELASMLVLPEIIPTGQNPAIAYLLSLQSPRSRVTMSSYLKRVAHFLGASSLEDCPWHLLTRQHVHALLRTFQSQELSPATCNTILAAVKGVMKEARALRLMTADDCQDIREVTAVRGSRESSGRALEPEEIKALLQACDDDGSLVSVRDKALFMVMLGCGLRRSEVVTLTLADYQPKDPSLLVMGKGNQQRKVYLPNTAVKGLRYYIDQVRGEQSGPLFIRFYRNDTLTNLPISAQSVFKQLKLRSLAGGIDLVSPHDLRRTFATSMLAKGVDLITVQRMMRHSSLETTKRYDKRPEKIMQEMLQKHFDLF